MPVNYTVGDATNPTENGIKVILHICNDIGGWGAGFVLALSKKWNKPENYYRLWFAQKTDLKYPQLGDIQVVKVEDDTYVVNMIAQKGVRTVDGVPPIRYEALRKCLKEVVTWFKGTHVSFVGPRMGAGLAGGNWYLIEKILEEELPAITIYDLEDVKNDRI